MSFFKRYQKIIKDVSYSLVAYALPTFALYFVVQPVIARYLSGEENGLFLTILSIIRYITNILITPLATLRLLEKSQCIANDELNSKFNHIYAIVTIIGVVVTGFIVFAYSNSADIVNILLSLVFLLFLFFHDYYYIAFRIIIDFKKITIDNALIVLGFFIGLGLFTFFHYWQLVFITGYLTGSIYVFFQARKIIHIVKMQRSNTPEINKKYVELSATSFVGYYIISLDKLLIYPILGGNNVSIYNAAGVVSKVISVISIPVRNVLLSYIVDKDKIEIGRKPYRRIILLTPVIMALLVFVFSWIGVILCKYLYPMFYDEAVKFIPLVVGAIVIKTIYGIVNLILLQFAKTFLQTLISIISLVLYLAFVFVFTFVLHMGLWGFCWSTILTAVVCFVIIIVLTRKHIKIKE